ncbi:MAG: hypothetical protein NTZ87_00395 [Candidatus Nomurabacteria bacterium]|nr:hypothetical protein [Candidatus Nomurabacteria bacterium]
MDKNRQTQNKVVETYAEDMAKVLEDDKSGVIKKIIHGEEEHEKEKKNLSPNSMKNKIFMLIGLLFFALGALILSYFFLNRKAPTVPVEAQFTPLIFNDQNAFLEVSTLNKDEIAQTVFNQVNTTNVKAGGVEGIYLTENKKVIGLRRFISLIKSSFVPGDNTLFVSDGFLMGAVNNETKDTFILIKIRSAVDIFDNLRAWEKKMFFDLHGFFGVDISSETNYLLTKDFENGIIGNKNARILYDKNKNIVMMYIYADDNSVVITNTENSAQEIMLRLAASRVKK